MRTTGLIEPFEHTFGDNPKNTWERAFFDLLHHRRYNLNKLLPPSFSTDIGNLLTQRRLQGRNTTYRKELNLPAKENGIHQCSRIARTHDLLFLTNAEPLDTGMARNGTATVRSVAKTAGQKSDGEIRSALCLFRGIS